MIKIPDDQWVCTILGIDNGSETLGIAIAEYDIRTRKHTIIHTDTLVVSKSAYIRYPGLGERSKLAARCRRVGDYIFDVCEEHNPDVTGCESPFSHLHVQSFMVLSKTMDAVDNAVYRYRPSLDFEKIPPGRAKKAACHPNKYSSDKDDIRKYILAADWIDHDNSVDLTSADEHQMDAVSVIRCITRGIEECLETVA